MLETPALPRGRWYIKRRAAPCHNNPWVEFQGIEGFQPPNWHQSGMPVGSLGKINKHTSCKSTIPLKAEVPFGFLLTQRGSAVNPILCTPPLPRRCPRRCSWRRAARVLWSPRVVAIFTTCWCDVGMRKP